MHALHMLGAKGQLCVHCIMHCVTHETLCNLLLMQRRRGPQVPESAAGGSSEEDQGYIGHFCGVQCQPAIACGTTGETLILHVYIPGPFTTNAACFIAVDRPCDVWGS